MISGFAAGSFKQLAFLPPLHVLASGSFAVVRFFRGMKNGKTISFVRVASAASHEPFRERRLRSHAGSRMANIIDKSLLINMICVMLSQWL